MIIVIPLKLFRAADGKLLKILTILATRLKESRLKRRDRGKGGEEGGWATMAAREEGKARANGADGKSKFRNAMERETRRGREEDEPTRIDPADTLD